MQLAAARAHIFSMTYLAAVARAYIFSLGNSPFEEISNHV
jgi:hypothetical protein